MLATEFGRELDASDIDTLITRALEDESDCESVLSIICEHIVIDTDVPLIRDALRWGFWYWMRQVEFGRMEREAFRQRLHALFRRYTLGSSRASTAEDIRIARLVLANLYSEARDPLHPLVRMA